MSKARDLADLLSGGTAGVPTFGGTGAIRVPNGTTAQRPTPSPGMVRYNSTLGVNEVYDSNGWSAIASPPAISSVSPVSFNGESGTSFTIDGANFDAGATVKFLTVSGTEYNAATVSRISSSRLSATTPQDFTVADEPLTVKVVNSSGLSSTLDSVIDCGGVPTWNTTSGNLTTAGSGSSVSTSISASDPDAGATVSYSVASGALPSGVSLNSSTGAISGTAPSVGSNTTYNFTARATDNAGNQTTRAFSIIIAVPAITVNSVEYQMSSARTFSTQGHYLLVPNVDMRVRLQLWGAGGGGGVGSSGPSRGGAGGYVEGEYDLLAGLNYVFLIGQGGRKAPTLSTGTHQPTGRAFPDGGQSQQNEGYGQAGGGGSTRFGLYSQSGLILTDSSANYNNTNAQYILIAGAGAGGVDYTYGWDGTPGGFGGGTSGAGGGAWYPQGESLNSTGKGGTQSAGGAGGTTPARLSFSESGAKYYGGDGSGSGGGGGYFGGGGARGYYSIGGGGSGLIGAGVSNGAFYTASVGQATHCISPNPRSNKPSSAGDGGVAGASVAAATHGYDGALIITKI